MKIKLKIFNKDLLLNNVPYERVVHDSHNVRESCILFDDVNEKRWKMTYKGFFALRITDMDYAGYHFLKGGDFPDDCYEEKEGYPVPQFRKHIMEVQDSKWIKELKKTLRKNSEQERYINEAKHLFIPCYDYIIEIIVEDIEIEEVKD